MKLSDKHTGLLDDLLKAQEESPGGANYLRFQAAHEDELQEIEHLRSNGLMEQRGRVYVLKLLGLSNIAMSNSLAKRHLAHCSTVFTMLRKNFKEEPEQRLVVNDLATKAELAASDVVRALTYLRDTPIWGGYSNDLTKPDSYVVVGISILQHKTLDSLLDQMRHWADQSSAQQEALKAVLQTADFASAHSGEITSAAYPYVSHDRLAELRTLTGKLDLSRLCKLCEELNLNYQTDCFIAVAMLIRGILDHVPPAFGCRKFSEVANHYGGTRSFRAAMQRLDTSLRHIADGHLHVQLRASEVLPTRNQVEFRAEVDLLLSELIRIQRGNSEAHS